MEQKPKKWQLLLLSVLILSFLTALVLVLRQGIGEGGAIGAGGKVAVVEVEGVILESTKIVKRLAKLEDKKEIKAVVIRIDSPGGGVGASQEIFEQVKRLKKTKKVIASMGGVAASGGYYIACPADKIVANPGTVTGSIGVLMEFLNFKDLLPKLHIKEVIIKSGKNKDLGNPFGDMTPMQRKILQDVSDDIHLQFKEAIAEHRKMPLAELDKIADGRIFSGRQAQKLKLVDELGNLQRAIELAGEMAGIEGKPKVVWIKEKKGLWKELLMGDSEEVLLGLLSRFLGLFGWRVDYVMPGGAL